MNRSLGSMKSSSRGASRDFQRSGSRGIHEAKIRSNLQGDVLRKSNDSAPSIVEDLDEVQHEFKGKRPNAKHVQQLFREVTEQRREKKQIPPFVSKYFESQQA